MAIITWQNVPIPQFSGVQQGFANAAQFLNQATHSGLAALNLIQRHMQDQADRAILDRMLAIQDPQEYALQMQQGAILGPERGRASLDTLLAAARHQDTLQARADTRYKSERARMLDTDRDRISEAVNAALTAGILGDPGQGALQLMAAQGHLDNTLDVYRLLAQMGLQQDANAARLQSARIRSGPANARLEREILIEDLAGRLFDYRHDTELFEDEIAKLPPEFRAAVRERVWELDRIESGAQRRREEDIQRLLGNSNAIQSGPRIPPRTNPNGGFTRFGAYNRVVSDGKIPQADGRVVNVTPENVFGKSLEELSGSEVEFLWRRQIEATKSAHPAWRAQMGLPEGQGTSAMGMYQLTRTAVLGDGKNKGLAQQIWGDEWRNIRLMAPENQERMARRLFEQNRGKDLKRIWAALPDAYRDPEFTKDLTWDEMRTVIASLESGYRPEAFEREVEIVRNRLENARMSPISLALQRARQNWDMSPSDVVTEIVKTPGMNLERKEVHDIISKFLEENRELSPAEAGAIFLNTYLDPREGIIKQAFQALTGQDRVNAIIKQMQATAKAEFEVQRETEKYLNKLNEAENNYRLAYEEVYGPQGALAGIQRYPNDQTAARRYQRALARLERYSQELENLVLNDPLEALSQKVEENKDRENNLRTSGASSRGYERRGSESSYQWFQPGNFVSDLGRAAALGSTGVAVGLDRGARALANAGIGILNIPGMLLNPWIEYFTGWNPGLIPYIPWANPEISFDEVLELLNRR